LKFNIFKEGSVPKLTGLSVPSFLQKKIPSSQEPEQPTNKTSSDTIPIEFNEPVPKFISVNKLEFIGTEIHGGIIKDPTSIGGLRYLVIQPRLSIKDKTNFDLIKKLLMTELSVSLADIKSKEDAEKRLRKKIVQLIKKYKLEIHTKNLSKIAYYAIRDFIYLGKIEPLMRDHMIEEISCLSTRSSTRNKHCRIFFCSVPKICRNF